MTRRSAHTQLVNVRMPIDLLTRMKQLRCKTDRTVTSVIVAGVRRELAELERNEGAGDKASARIA